MRESYNIKVVEYGNGTVTICKYKERVGLSHSHKGKQALSKEDSATKKYLEEMGFGKVRLMRGKSYKEMQMYEHINEYNSLIRTKRKINELARSCDWEYFVTLTFSPDKVSDRTDFKALMKKARQWLNNQQKRHAPRLLYIAVPETHKRIEDNGLHAWHVHILMADIGDMQLIDTGLVAIGKKNVKRTSDNMSYPTIYNLTGWRYGYSTAIKITDNSEHKIATYITKYITKELMQSSSKAHRYYASRNLKPSTVTTYNMTDKEKDDFIQNYLINNNKKIVYETKSNKFNEVHFLELDIDQEKE